MMMTIKIKIMMLMTIKIKVMMMMMTEMTLMMTSKKSEGDDDDDRCLLFLPFPLIWNSFRASKIFSTSSLACIGDYFHYPCHA